MCLCACSETAATLRREIALKAQQDTSNNSSSSGSGEGSSGDQSTSVDESSQDKQQRADQQQEHDELSDERLVREATEELCSVSLLQYTHVMQYTLLRVVCEPIRLLHHGRCMCVIMHMHHQKVLKGRSDH